MKRLLQFAQTKFDEAEVFFCQSAKCKLSIENGNLKNLGGEINSGYAIRGIKRNILGTSFLNNLSNREGAAKGAALSMAGKVEAKFSFPASAKIKNKKSYDKTVESMTFSDLSDLGQEISCFFDGKVKGQMNQYMGFNREEKRIINTEKGEDFVEAKIVRAKTGSVRSNRRAKSAPRS